MRINYTLLGRIREIRIPKSKLLNINYEHLGKVLDAKKKQIKSS